MGSDVTLFGLKSISSIFLFPPMWYTQGHPIIHYSLSPAFDSINTDTTKPENDTLFFFNYRSDRMRELATVLGQVGDKVVDVEIPKGLVCLILFLRPLLRK